MKNLHYLVLLVFSLVLLTGCKPETTSTDPLGTDITPTPESEPNNTDSKNESNSTETPSLKIHFLNRNYTTWSAPYIYYWYDSNEGVESNEWPGSPMSLNESGWYSFTIKNTDVVNIVFNNHENTSQTVDLKRSDEGWFVPNGIDDSGKIVGDWYETEPPIDSIPVDKSIVELRRTQTLALLSNLSFGNVTEYKGVISGQNCYHGDQITDSSYIKGYETMIQNLRNETDEWVGVIGLDYEYDQLYTPDQLSEANRYLIDYFYEGGIVTINFSPHNPWVNDESDLLNNPGSPTGDSSPQSEFSRNAVTSLNDLLDEEKVVHHVWMRKLDRIADALEELRDAGVIVLWRPLQEMNGSWMWWGMHSHPDNPEPYINLYHHMYEYFTDDRELNNLLWVYSPNSTYGDVTVINNVADWNRNVIWAYPGDDYVDIVSGTEYGNDLKIYDYEWYASLGKPMGLGETGPGDFGDMDAYTIVEQLSTNYPRIAYWVSWHWNWAIINQENYSSLMIDSKVLNRNEFDISLESGEIVENLKVDTPELAPIELTLHFLNDYMEWDSPHLYYWYYTSDGIVSNEWPGDPMERIDNSNWYTITLDGTVSSNVIFTSSNTPEQTVDLFRDKEGWFVPIEINEEGKIIGTWYDERP